jgi:hypothetical protein
LQNVILSATSSDIHAGIKAFIQLVSPILEKLAKQYTTSNWIAGKNISYLDFMFYEVFKAIQKQDPSLLPQPLHLLIKNFEEIQQIKSYLSSDRFKDLPYFSPDMDRVLFTN